MLQCIQCSIFTDVKLSHILVLYFILDTLTIITIQNNIKICIHLLGVNNNVI